MITYECPACGFGFVNRRAGRCPKCAALLVHAGETYRKQGSETVYVWTGEAWGVLGARIPMD